MKEVRFFTVSQVLKQLSEYRKDDPFRPSTIGYDGKDIIVGFKSKEDMESFELSDTYEGYSIKKIATMEKIKTVNEVLKEINPDVGDILIDDDGTEWIFRIYSTGLASIEFKHNGIMIPLALINKICIHGLRLKEGKNICDTCHHLERWDFLGDTIPVHIEYRCYVDKFSTLSENIVKKHTCGKWKKKEAIVNNGTL